MTEHTELPTLGDLVENKRGYKFPGEVVSVFETLNGDLRYVVECTAEGAKGCLHIYSAKDLTLTPEPT